MSKFIKTECGIVRDKNNEVYLEVWVSGYKGHRKVKDPVYFHIDCHTTNPDGNIKKLSDSFSVNLKERDEAYEE